MGELRDKNEKLNIEKREKERTTGRKEMEGENNKLREELKEEKRTREEMD